MAGFFVLHSLPVLPPVFLYFFVIILILFLALFILYRSQFLVWVGLSCLIFCCVLPLLLILSNPIICVGFFLFFLFGLLQATLRRLKCQDTFGLMMVVSQTSRHKHTPTQMHKPWPPTISDRNLQWSRRCFAGLLPHLTGRWVSCSIHRMSSGNITSCSLMLASRHSSARGSLATMSVSFSISGIGKMQSGLRKSSSSKSYNFSDKSEMLYCHSWQKDFQLSAVDRPPAWRISSASA